jgi:hypothetical protein
MSKQNFDSEELVKLFHKIHQRLDWLTCAIKECCSKIPINIGDGIGLFKRLANNKWEFKSLVEGDNITITETTEEIIISSQATPFSCEDVNECLGISDIGEPNKFLNEQGDFITVSGSGFTCSDLETCSTSNLPEGSRLYFTDGRAVTALTGQNISLFTNNSGFITSSALSPYLTIASATSTYQPIGSYLTEAVADTKYYSITNPSGFITSSALTPYLLSSTASSTYEPIITPGTTSQWRRGDNTWQLIDKSTVGLSNVDNTSDASKPISTATQTALNLKANLTQVQCILSKMPSEVTLTTLSGEQILYTHHIPANTLSAKDILIIRNVFNKSTSTGTTNLKIRVTEDAVPGSFTTAQIIGSYNPTLATTFISFERNRIFIKNDSTWLSAFTTISMADDVSTSSYQEKAYNRTVDLYIHITAQNVATTDVLILDSSVILKQ